MARRNCSRKHRDSRRSGHYQEYLPILPQTKELRTNPNKNEKEEKRTAERTIPTLGIANTDRATCYLRYRDDLYPWCGSFLKFRRGGAPFAVSFRRASTIKEEGKLHCHVGYASSCEQEKKKRKKEERGKKKRNAATARTEGEQIDKAARKRRREDATHYDSCLRCGKNPRIRINGPRSCGGFWF